jgi:hypothetical protein
MTTQRKRPPIESDEFTTTEGTTGSDVEERLETSPEEQVNLTDQPGHEHDGDGLHEGDPAPPRSHA